MYVPGHFEETRMEVLHNLIKSHPLGTLITLCEGEIVANHVPFILDQSGGDSGTLKCHVAKSNPVWKLMSEDLNSLVIFQGPDAYISPSWYPSKYPHGKAVPTWNYIVVHARGVPTITDDSDWLLNHVCELSEIHESSRAIPWTVSDAPIEYIEKMVGAIVGIEIPIMVLTGKWKLSQNRPQVDQVGVMAGLASEGGDWAAAMSQLMQQIGN